MLNAMRADPDRSLLLVIDLQDKLVPLIDGREAVLRNTEFLVRGASIFGLPTLVTEQYVKGLGRTVEPTAACLRQAGAVFLEKTAFSACGDETVRDRLRNLDRDQVLIAGIETHVCVQATVLDLLAMDYQVFVCADAVGARGAEDARVALDRLRQAGATITTVESLLFELCQECGTERFKRLLELIKTARPTVQP